MIGPFSRVDYKKEGTRTRGFECRYSHYFAGGFALRRCRDNIKRYSAAPRCEFEKTVSAIPTQRLILLFHLYPVSWSSCSLFQWYQFPSGWEPNWNQLRRSIAFWCVRRCLRGFLLDLFVFELLNFLPSSFCEFAKK